MNPVVEPPWPSSVCHPRRAAARQVVSPRVAPAWLRPLCARAHGVRGRALKEGEEVSLAGSVLSRILAVSSGVRLLRRARSTTSQFNGVCWNRKQATYQASVRFEGQQHYVGVFSSEEEAAHAYDAELRALCDDPVRLKKSLNFPTEEEASFEESLRQSRSRGLRRYSQSLTKKQRSLFAVCKMAF